MQALALFFKVLRCNGTVGHEDQLQKSHDFANFLFLFIFRFVNIISS